MSARPGMLLVSKIASMIAGFKPLEGIGMTPDEQAIEMARSIAILAFEDSGAAQLRVTIERLEGDNLRKTVDYKVLAARTSALRPFVEQAHAQGILASDVDNDLLMMSSKKHRLLAGDFARAIAAFDLEEAY